MLIKFRARRQHATGGWVMILGLGIDLLRNRRVEQELARGVWRLDDGIFSQEEIAYCNSARRPASRYAACFAAKEATLKALGVPVSDLAIFRDVELRLGSDNEVRVVLHNRAQARGEQLGMRHLRLALAHSASQTAAMVVLEG